jgi:hypothetical protein
LQLARQPINQPRNASVKQDSPEFEIGDLIAVAPGHLLFVSPIVDGKIKTGLHPQTWLGHPEDPDKLKDLEVSYNPVIFFGVSREGILVLFENRVYFCDKANRKKWRKYEY